MAANLEKHFHSAVIEGKAYSNEWNDEAFLKDEPSCSSANWCTHANAIGLLTDSANPRYKNWWLTYFEQSKYRFFGKEPFSRIYLAWIIMPVVAVYNVSRNRNDTELYSASEAWLKAAWAYLAFTAFPVRHKFKYYRFGNNEWKGIALTAAGARSWEREKNGNGTPIGNPMHIDGWALDWIFNRVLFGVDHQESRPIPGWDDYHLSMIQKFEVNGVSWSGLSAVDRDWLKELVANPNIKNIEYALTLVKAYIPMAEFRFYRFEKGACTIMPRFGVSNATAPLYGKVVYEDGTIDVLACDPGARPVPGWPGAVEPGEVTIDLENRFASVSRLNGDKLDILAVPRMNLPQGELIFEIICGNGEPAKLIQFKGKPVITTPGTQPTKPNPDTKPNNPNNPDNSENVDFEKEFYLLIPKGTDPFKIARSVASMRTPKNTKEIGNNILKFGSVFWETCSKYMNPIIRNSDYRRAYEAYSGLVSMLLMCGQFLATGNREYLETLKKGLLDVHGKL